MYLSRRLFSNAPRNEPSHWMIGGARTRSRHKEKLEGMARVCTCVAVPSAFQYRRDGGQPPCSIASFKGQGNCRVNSGLGFTALPLLAGRGRDNATHRKQSEPGRPPAFRLHSTGSWFTWRLHAKVTSGRRLGVSECNPSVHCSVRKPSLISSTAGSGGKWRSSNPSRRKL